MTKNTTGPKSSQILRLLSVLFVFFLTIGCGTPCAEIARHREEFHNRQAPATNEPHFIASVPLTTINRLIEPRVRAIEPLPLELPGGGILAQYLDGFFLQPRQATLVPSVEGNVGIEVMLDVIRRDQVFFSLRVEGDIQPQFDAEHGHVEVELRAEDFRSMEPELSAGAAERLAQALYRILPGMARMLITPQTIVGPAETITAFVLNTAYPLLRDRLFTGLGPIAQFSVSMPDIPIERIGFSTNDTEGGQLLLSGFTTFSVTAGVTQNAALQPSRDTVALAISGSTVAELANWAMERGQLPRRFDENGRPRENGQYEAALAWSEDAEARRPLRVHVWQLEPRCLRAMISASPDLRLDEGRVVLDVQEPHVDVLEGPPFAEVARWFAPIWLRAMNRTQSAASSFSLDVAGNPVQARVTAIERVGQSIRLGLDISGARAEASATTLATRN